MSLPPSIPLQSPGHGSQTEDLALFTRLGAGDATALSELYDRYGRIVFSLAARMLSDVREREEVTQDVFLAMWRNPSVYRPEKASPLTWIATITRNKCIDRLRQSGRRLPFVAAGPETFSSIAEDRASDPTMRADLEDLSGQVRECLDRLPESQRSTLERAYFESLSTEEISSRDELPAATVKSRLRLALDKMRRCLRHKLVE